MRGWFALLGLVLAGFASAEAVDAPHPAFPPVAIDGEWITVGGERFLVVGVGYEAGTRPGRLPYTRDFRPDLLRADFERIRAAGFNAMRTWAPLTDDELELAAEYGLWVIQGLWYDSEGDFADPRFQEQVLASVREEVKRGAKHPNILFYLIGNEPHADAVYEAGHDEMNAFYRRLIQAARECDPERLFSYANCIFTDSMAPTMWDLTAQNAYPYSPVTIEKVLGYRAYLRELKRKLAPGKPFIITEFGLSVSPTGDGRGYGGNTLEQQRDGMLALWDDVLSAGATGGCPFMWTDGWWKFRDENTHDDHAEEWYGFLATDDDFVGEPRPVYFALQDYQRAIRTLPIDGGRYADSVDIEIWSPTARRVEARLNDGDWFTLEHQGSWWRGAARLKDVPIGLHQLHTRMQTRDGDWASEKTAYINVVHKPDVDRADYAVSLVGLPEQATLGGPLEVVVEVLDADGRPVKGKAVQLGRFFHGGWDEHEDSGVTDEQGQSVFSVPMPVYAGMVSVAASVDGDKPARNATGWKQSTAERYVAYEHLELVK